MDECGRQLLIKLAEALSGPWSPLGLVERHCIDQFLAAFKRTTDHTHTDDPPRADGGARRITKTVDTNTP